MPDPSTEIRQQWSEIRESQRTGNCIRGAHSDCPHLSGMGLFMDRQALVAALFGVAIGALGGYFLARLASFS